MPETRNGYDSSSDINEMSPYSSQLLLTVFLKAPGFRNPFYKSDVCSTAKKLNVNAQGLGKYELANKVAKVLFSNAANITCLKRDQITVLRALGEPDVRDVTENVAVAHNSSPCSNAESGRDD